MQRLPKVLTQSPVEFLSEVRKARYGERGIVPWELVLEACPCPPTWYLNVPQTRDQGSIYHQRDNHQCLRSAVGIPSGSKSICWAAQSAQLVHGSSQDSERTYINNEHSTLLCKTARTSAALLPKQSHTLPRASQSADVEKETNVRNATAGSRGSMVRMRIMWISK